jgi:hypothetical protein
MAVINLGIDGQVTERTIYRSAREFQLSGVGEGASSE